MLYANDVVFTFQVPVNFLKALGCILELFGAASGDKVNDLVSDCGYIYTLRTERSTGGLYISSLGRICYIFGD